MRNALRVINWKFVGEIVAEAAGTLALWLIVMIVTITGLKLLHPAINLLSNWLRLG